MRKTLPARSLFPPLGEGLPSAARRCRAPLGQEAGPALGGAALREAGAFQRLSDQAVDPRLLLPVGLAVALDGLLDQPLDACLLLRIAMALAFGTSETRRGGGREGEGEAGRR